MTDRQIELTRRKILAGVGAVGAAGAAAGLGTDALFSDGESFANNSLTAGELDLKVAWQEHYSDSLGADERAAAKIPGTGDTPDFRLPNGPGEGGDIELKLIDADGDGNPANDFLRATRETRQNGGIFGNTADSLCDESADVPDNRALIELSDVKPGDFGFVFFRLELCTNPGFLWLTGKLESATENGVTEPEDSEDNEDGDGSSTDPVDVELLDEIQVAYGVGTTNDLSASDPGANLLPDRDPNSTVPQPAEQVTLREFLNSIETGDGILLDGSPADGNGTESDCFAEETSYYVSVVWWLPLDTGNRVQSDQVSFDLGFYTEQCRNNPAGERETYPAYQANLARTGVSDNAGPGSDVTEKWRFDLGDDPAPPVVDTGSDPTVFVCVNPDDGGEPSVYAIDAETGTERWAAVLDRPEKSFLPEAIDQAPFAGKEALYFGTDAGNLYALDKSDGSVLWRRSLNVDTAAINSSPLVIGDTLFVSVENVQDDEPALFAIDAKDGSTKWTKSVGTVGETTSTPAYADGRVYIAGDNVDGDNLFAFNLNGTKAWSRDLLVDELSVRNGRLYAEPSRFGGGTLALDAADGTTIWEADVGTSGPPAVTDDAVYVSGGFEEVSALDPSDGSVQWTFDLGERSDAAPVVADDTIIIGRQEGFGFFAPSPSRLYGIAPDGTEKWRFEPDDAGDFDTEVAVANGTVFAVSGSFDEGTLYALE